MDIQYIGENLWPGYLGQFFIVLSFVTAIFSSIAYFFANKEESSSWKKLARGSFYLHTIGILGIIISLAYIIGSHLFEYHYAWAHSSKSLPTEYVVSSFWEGQEGSFLLWAFWQMVLSWVVIKTAGKWESSVMAVILLSQVFICSMLLGVDVFGQVIGSSPFILLREALQAPIFQRANYLSMIEDGNGLNPLLQNYWMVIHPPTLFLGFASMVVPFAFAIAGVWNKKYDEWMKPALPWSLFAVMVLGTGIIMGSFWAYEALNFGGFWAWDPVENASLIPWLTLIAAVHVILAYKHTGHSYFTALFLVFISYVLVLYASFLTRSGILGEASVHAFTDLGMSGQLVIYILVFLVLGTWLIVKNWKAFPITKKDEETYSREFWLFIGAIMLGVSCFQIIVTTSIPVINKIIGTNFAPPTDVIDHYNKWQIPIAVLILLISGLAQFMKYKKTDNAKFISAILVSLVLSIVFTGLIAYFAEFLTNIPFMLLIFASVFTILANTKILTDVFSGKIKLAGSALAHIGFGFILLGALIAASKSDVISINKSGFSYGKEFNEKNTRENILLWKDEPTRMGNYMVTYKGDSTEAPNTYYEVFYQKLNKEGKVVDEFTLYPNAQVNPKMGLIASPDTRHYVFEDVYTHVSSVPFKEEEEHEPHEGHSDDENYQEPKILTFSVGDTLPFENYSLVLANLNNKVEVKDLKLTSNDLAVAAEIKVLKDGKVYEASPVYIIKNNIQFDLPKAIDEAGMKFKFSKIDPQAGKVEITFYEKKPKQRDYIIMKAIVFPFINLLWGGTIIMVIGFAISIVRRIKEYKHQKA
jgi:cytochrome c-type biogenesis protein CcmF